MKQPVEKISIGLELNPFMFAFTSSRNPSTGVALDLDMKSRKITISENLTPSCHSETLSMKVDDLFDEKVFAKNPMFASTLQFDPGEFTRLILLIVDFINSSELSIPSDRTFVIPIRVINFGAVYEKPGDWRLLTASEFSILVGGMLYVAQFKIYREYFLNVESLNDPDWDEKSGEPPIVRRPPEIFTVVRMGVDGRCDLFTTSSKKTALRKSQEHVDEISKNYPKGKLHEDQRFFDEEEGIWRTPDNYQQVFLYETELIDSL